MNDDIVTQINDNRMMLEALKSSQRTSLDSFGAYVYNDVIYLPSINNAGQVCSAVVTFKADNSNSSCLNVSATMEPEADPLVLEYYGIGGRNNGPAMRREPSSQSGLVRFISGANLASAGARVKVQVLSAEPGSITVEVVQHS